VLKTTVGGGGERGKTTYAGGKKNNVFWGSSRGPRGGKKKDTNKGRMEKVKKPWRGKKKGTRVSQGERSGPKGKEKKKTGGKKGDPRKKYGPYGDTTLFCRRGTAAMGEKRKRGKGGGNLAERKWGEEKFISFASGGERGARPLGHGREKKEGERKSEVHLRGWGRGKDNTSIVQGPKLKKKKESCHGDGAKTHFRWKLDGGFLEVREKKRKQNDPQS